MKKATMIRDQVFRGKDGGWYCIVNGVIYGGWAVRQYAVAGMKTEQQRLQRKADEAARAVARLRRAP